MEKHLVVNNFNEVEYASLVLKAHLIGKSVEDIVNHEINDIPLHISEDKECFWCREQGSLYIAHHDSHTYYSVAGKMHKIFLSKYPVITCNSCKRTIDDIKVECEIDHIIDLEVANALKMTKRVPNIIELDLI